VFIFGRGLKAPPKCSLRTIKIIPETTRSTLTTVGASCYAHLMSTDQWGFPALLPSAIVRDLTREVVMADEAEEADWAFYAEAIYVDPMEDARF
jgi:hypothetical protein